MNNLFINNIKKFSSSRISVQGQSYTGAQILHKKNDVVKSLSAYIFLPNDRVVLVGEGGFEWLSCYFALLDLNLKIIPIDAGLETKVIQAKINQASPRYILSLSKMDLDLGGFEEHKLGESLYFYHCQQPIVQHEDNALMMIASSGTSGAEKLIMLSRANIQAVLDLYDELLQKVSFDCVMICLPISAIYPLAITLVCLNAGKKVVFCNPKNENLSQVMIREEVEIVPAVPLMLEMIHKAIFSKIENNPLKKWIIRRILDLFGFMRRRWAVNLGPFVLKIAHKPFGDKLKLFLSGGATLSVSTLKDFYNLGFTIYEGYGLTEAAGLVTYRMDDYSAFGTVGKVSDRVLMKISDQDEILLKGPQIFSGYFNQQNETSSAFDMGWFKTGDKGMLDANGNLIVKGRIKDIIFLSDENGYAPETIEEYYKGIPGIKEFIVVGWIRENTSGDYLSLVAVKEEGVVESKVLADVESHKKHIPPLFHIQDVIFLDEILKNKLGKVCRNVIKANIGVR
ncbi:MAG: AMP-binding protein [Alphaproteobacteria bacterium]|nr:AMP-binding protein [Alphaproteobacteria bacterium]